MHRTDHFTTAHAQRVAGVFHPDRCLLAFAGAAICAWGVSLAWLWAA